MDLRNSRYGTAPGRSDRVPQLPSPAVNDRRDFLRNQRWRGGNLLAEVARDPKSTEARRDESKITYDYGKGAFVRSGIEVGCHASKPVVVGNLNSRGNFTEQGVGVTPDKPVRAAADGAPELPVAQQEGRREAARAPRAEEQVRALEARAAQAAVRGAASSRSELPVRILTSR